MIARLVALSLVSGQLAPESGAGVAALTDTAGKSMCLSLTLRVLPSPV